LERFEQNLKKIRPKTGINVGHLEVKVADITIIQNNNTQHNGRALFLLGVVLC
jgi:hypothetical protein